jgi:hypothetical protein
MMIPVENNELPDLKTGDVLFAHFKLSCITSLDYLFSAWILPNIYLHVAFVVRDCIREDLNSDDAKIIFDAVRRRVKKKAKRQKVTLRTPKSFLQNMKVLGIGRIKNLPLKDEKYKELQRKITELCARDTDYSMIRYKCPHSDPPSFSCYGLVEYCYEQLGLDLVADDRYVGKRYLGIPGIPCFRPGHQRQAFREKRYAFKGNSVL